MAKKYKTILPPHLLEEAKTKVEDFLAKVRKVETETPVCQEYEIILGDWMGPNIVREDLKVGSCFNMATNVRSYANSIHHDMRGWFEGKSIALYKHPETSELFKYCRDDQGNHQCAGDTFQTEDKEWRTKNRAWHQECNLNYKSFFFVQGGPSEKYFFGKNTDKFLDFYRKTNDELAPLSYCFDFSRLWDENQQITAEELQKESESREEKNKKYWEKRREVFSQPLPGEVESSGLPELVFIDLDFPQQTALTLQNECDKIILEMKQLYKRYRAWKKTSQK